MSKRKVKEAMRKYVTHAQYVEAIYGELDQRRRPKMTCGYSESNPRPRRVLSNVTTIETRTGSGVTRRKVRNCKGFGHTAGVIRQSLVTTGNYVENGLRKFYGQIDHDLRMAREREDLKLGVAPVVAEEKLRKREWRLQCESAKRRGRV